MKHPRGLVPGAVLLLIVGVATMSRFAPGVRSVAVVGLTGGGFALGLALGLLLQALRSRPRIEAGKTRAT